MTECLDFGLFQILDFDVSLYVHTSINSMRKELGLLKIKIPSKISTRNLFYGKNVVSCDAVGVAGKPKHRDGTSNHFLNICGYYIIPIYSEAPNPDVQNLDSVEIRTHRSSDFRQF